MVHDSNEHEQKWKENDSMVHDPNKHEWKWQRSSHVPTPLLFCWRMVPWFMIQTNADGSEVIMLMIATL